MATLMLISPYPRQIESSSTDEVVKATRSATYNVHPILERPHLILSTVPTHHQKLPGQDEGERERERGGGGGGEQQLKPILMSDILIFRLGNTLLTRL